MALIKRSTKGTSLTFDEMDGNFTHLGGDGSYQFPATDGTSNQILTTDGNGQLSFANTGVLTDLAPQLGGNLDVNGNSIISTSDGDIAITPNGTGKVILDGLSYPTTDGTTGQFLKTDGSGNLSFTEVNVGFTFASVSFTAGDSAELVTGLPSGIQELIIVTEDINTNLAGVYIRIQLGTSGGTVTSGYKGGAFGHTADDSSFHGGGIVLVDAGITSSTTITSSYTKIVNVATNKYVASGSTASQDGSGDGDAANSSHHSFIDIGGELERFRINDSGSRTFDSGTIYYGYK